MTASSSPDRRADAAEAAAGPGGSGASGGSADRAAGADSGAAGGSADAASGGPARGEDRISGPDTPSGGSGDRGEKPAADAVRGTGQADPAAVADAASGAPDDHAAGTVVAPSARSARTASPARGGHRTAGSGGEADEPSARGAAFGHGLGYGLVHGAWRLRVLGAWRIPAQGPVILAGNHSHNVDGPIVIGTSPRPVHFLVKKQAFVGPLDPFLRGIGQIAVDREAADRTAITRALGVLAAGCVLGIFPEGTRGDGEFAELRSGLAYFAVRSGAPVVPVAVLGSARHGRVVRSLPPLRARIDVVFGEPFTAAAAGGRRTRAALDAATARIRERLTAHLAEARRATGR